MKMIIIAIFIHYRLVYSIGNNKCNQDQPVIGLWIFARNAEVDELVL